MLFPLIGVRLHGWLDDLVVLTYLAGAYAVGLQGIALRVAVTGAALHFTLARITNYPQGQLKVVPFRIHAFIELAEGLAVLAAAWTVVPATQPGARPFLTLLGLSELAAFSFSDYRWPTS